MSAATAPYVLYGSPHSYYTAKVRCYLRKQGIAYRERMPSHPSFMQQVVPEIGRSIIPVLATPEGELIQDSIDIIDHFEAQGVAHSAYPSGPRQRVLALWIEYFGNFCMLRPAMHYRWSYFSEQAAYVTDANVSCSGSEVAQMIMQRMRSYLPALGVTPNTVELIHQAFLRLLDVLEAHFSQHPYLFGGQPCIADYGLIGPMYAHLARDPVPAQLMRSRAPKVFRWVERMTAADADIPEYPDYSEQLLADDQVPPTLLPLLALMREEIFPELDDKLQFLQQWVQQQAPLDGQPVSHKAHQRNLGQILTHYRGVEIESGVAPYLIYSLRRINQFVEGLDGATRASLLADLSALQYPPGLPESLGYSVGRKQHVEVWEIPS